ncbi:chaperonin 10-like protein [Panaeolus papilionaceus]|nr:chaperonin 10-like protein [Panaeolus papilionaceus]
MSARLQKALFLESKQGDFVLREAPIPQPGTGQLLIKIKATGLNPIDWKIQKFGVYVEQYPAILGSDIAGDVEEVGEGVTEFNKGDRVFCQGQMTNETTAFQQYTIGLAVTTARIPDGFSYDDMATIPLGISTAYAAFYNPNPTGLGLVAPIMPQSRGMYVNEPIFIMGGASNVGRMAIQIAKLSGFSPIITTASLSNSDELTDLGATHIIDRKLSSEDLSARVGSILGNLPLKLVFNAISTPDTQKIALDLLAPGGQMQLVGPPTESPPDKTVNRVVAMLRLPTNIPQLEPLYHEHISHWVAEGVIKPNRVEVIPNGLAGIVDGLKRLQANDVSRGKLVVRPQETP